MPRHVLHDVTERWGRARLHALTGAGQDIVGDGRLRLRRGCFAGRCERRLKRANGVFEGQAVGFENFSGNASGVSHDRGEYDGAVDIAPAAASGRSGRCFQNAPNLRRNTERILRGCAGRGGFQYAGDDVALDPFTADLARVEHGDGIRVVTEGCEQMLKRDL